MYPHAQISQPQSHIYYNNIHRKLITLKQIIGLQWICISSDGDGYLLDGQFC